MAESRQSNEPPSEVGQVEGADRKVKPVEISAERLNSIIERVKKIGSPRDTNGGSNAGQEIPNDWQTCIYISRKSIVRIFLNMKNQGEQKESNNPLRLSNERSEKILKSSLFLRRGILNQVTEQNRTETMGVALKQADNDAGFRDENN